MEQDRNNKTTSVLSSTPIKKNWRNSLVLSRSSDKGAASTASNLVDPDPPWWSDEDDDEKTDRTAGSLNNNNNSGSSNGSTKINGDDEFESFSGTEDEEEDGDQVSLDSITTSR